MKKVAIYDDAHREAKVEAARLGRTMPNTLSELIRLGAQVSRKQAATPAKEPKRKPAGK